MRACSCAMLDANVCKSSRCATPQLLVLTLSPFTDSPWPSSGGCKVQETRATLLPPRELFFLLLLSDSQRLASVQIK
jgi:hypothetical protein